MTDPCDPRQPGEEGGGATAAGWNNGQRNTGEDNDTMEEDGGEEEQRVYNPTLEPFREAEGLNRGDLLFNFSVGKNRWIADAGHILGKPEEFGVPVFDERVDPRVKNSYPANAPNILDENSDGRRQETLETIQLSSNDTFRYVTGKYWINFFHGLGPLGVTRRQFFRERRDGDEGFFSFHNPRRRLFGGPNVRLEVVAEEDFNGLSLEDSIGYGALSEAFNSNDELNTGIYSDIFRIRFPRGTDNLSISNQAVRRLLRGRGRWNWRDYMYGLPGSTTLPSVVDDLRRGNFEGAVGEDVQAIWPSWEEAYYSRNIFPVIPFYGLDQSRPLPADAYTNKNLRPPQAGLIIFYDHVTNIPAFLTKDEVELNDIVGSSFSDINGVYNFYDCVYEDMISPAYQEVNLPNFYKYRPENFRNLNNADGVSAEEIVTNQIQALRAELAAEDLRPSAKRLIERQLGIFTRNAIESYGVLDPRIFGDVSRVDIYANPESEDFKRIYRERRLFPMYTEIEFSSRDESLIAKAISEQTDTDFNELILPFANFSQGIITGQNVVYPIRFEMVNQYLASGTPEEESINFVSDSAPSDTVAMNLPTMNLDNWLKWVRESEPEPREGREEEADLTPQEKFRRIISSLIAKAKIREIVQDKYRKSFQDVLSGKPAHSEVIAYRVEKYDSNLPGSTRQNFYFNTSEEAQSIKYIDSQVEYGKTYTYKIYQVVVIVGTKYAYLDCNSEVAIRTFYEDSLARRDRASLSFRVVHKPSVQIVEVPMQEQEIAILDRPPIAPDVDVIPFKGSASRILFNLNSGTGEVFAPPILLESDDEAQFENIARNQKARFSPDMVPESDTPVNPDDLIQFKNDDQTRIFEVFRVETEPRSWRDFFGNKIGRIESEATNASFRDSVEPNKKYYYTFRSEDVHGHVSNPSHIYQVELVKDGEMTFMKMEIFKFKKRVNTSVGSFKNRIEIRPAFLQRIIELPSNGIFDEWEEEKKIGNSSNPVWGKKFKVRITSKSTGKQIDLNFKFVQKYARILEQEQNTAHNSDIC
tara:strand:+ start:958 stop:4068 length:3111 start_codon:yes stop_codon:yes gene_type:complete